MEIRQQNPFAPGSGMNNADDQYYGPGNVSESPVSTYPGTSSGGDSSGMNFTMPNWITNQMNNFQGVLSNPALFPSLAAAYQQYQQAHQYTDLAEKYASTLDPFGAQRAQYQKLLSDSYTNPGAVLADPAHQAELKASLDNVGRTGASQGFLGSGNMEQALYDYAQKDNAAWLQNYRNGLIVPSGANIGPQAAASMLQTGLLGRMGAENNAIGSLMYPFGNQASNNRANGTDGSGNNTTNPGNKIPLNPQNPGPALQRLQAAGFDPRTAAQLFQALISDPGSISPSTIATLNDLGIMTPGMDNGMDYAPGGYTGSSFGSGIDPSYGMNPNAGVDPSTTSILNSDPYGGTFGGSYIGDYGSNSPNFDMTGGSSMENWYPTYDNFGPGLTDISEIEFP